MKAKAQLGLDDLVTLTIMGVLANGYRAAGRSDKAVPLAEELLEKTRAKFGPDHHNTFRNMNVLALAYQGTGRHEKAVPLLEEALRKSQDKLGKDDIRTLLSMTNLARAYRDAGRLDKALPLIDRAFDEFKSSHPDHPGMLSIRFNLINLYVDEYLKPADRDKARPLPARILGEMKALLEQVRDKHGRDTALVDRVLALMGYSLLRQQNHSEAEPVLRECLASREKTQPDAWSTFNAKSMLGGALLGQKEYAAAEPLLVAGYEGMKRREKQIPPQGKIHLTEALERLVELYDKTGANDKADARRK